MKTLTKKKRNYDRVELYAPETVIVSNGVCPNQGICNQNNGGSNGSGGGYLKGIINAFRKCK